MSCRGVQYLSIKYSERLEEAKIGASVGSVGDSYDNALAETINGLYKAEVTRHEGPWRGKKDVELATLVWVQWYDDKRLYGPLGYISPATAERNFYNAELTANIAAEYLGKKTAWITFSLRPTTPRRKARSSPGTRPSRSFVGDLIPRIKSFPASPC